MYELYMYIKKNMIHTFIGCLLHYLYVDFESFFSGCSRRNFITVTAGTQVVTTKLSRACCGRAYKLAINAGQTRTARDCLCSTGFRGVWQPSSSSRETLHEKDDFYEQLPR